MQQQYYKSVLFSSHTMLKYKNADIGRLGKG